jgi:hypothetical protein
MNRHRNVGTVAIGIVLLFVGCRGAVPQDSLRVGTCVLVDDRGTAVVPCSETHTHKVIAIAERAEACPPETVMFSQPADPDDGLTTTCFQSDTTPE